VWKGCGGRGRIENDLVADGHIVQAVPVEEVWRRCGEGMEGCVEGVWSERKAVAHSTFMHSIRLFLLQFMTLADCASGLPGELLHDHFTHDDGPRVDVGLRGNVLGLEQLRGLKGENGGGVWEVLQ
jgi:hypothetical protein